jgi:hypothetical protein
MSLSVDLQALTVAMTLVPGMYARNRMYRFHEQPDVRRAKARASLLRGVVRQLTGAHGAVEELSLARHGETSLLRYRVPRLHLERRVELSEIERACLVFLAGRAGVPGLHAGPDERAHLDATLRRLAAIKSSAAESVAPEIASLAVELSPAEPRPDEREARESRR